MAVTYAQTLSTDMLLTEIEALLDWRGQIMRQCFFGAVKGADAHAPSVLLMWCRRAAENGKIDRRVIEGIAAVYDELCKAAQKMLTHGAAPTLEIFEAFENQFDGYVVRIRRLYQDVSGEGMTVDPVTGLRTAAGLAADIKREQDRFDRKGVSYSIAAIEIDRMAEMEQQYDRRATEGICATVAKTVAGMIRSFDDAYVTGRGSYILLLKHINFGDACVVMDRLKNEIASQSVFLPGGDRLKITASLGIAEALPREAAEVNLKNARTALERAQQAGGNSVHDFREKSVLEQIKDTKKF